MASLSKTAPAGADHDASKKPRDFWETIITTTPVGLTVVATILAGLSSSEMTQAQYHRSLAAQEQSKGADQWSFAQFKKTRGLIGQTRVNWNQTVPVDGGAQRLQTAAQRLSNQFEQGQNAANQLQQAAGMSQEDLKEAGQPLQAAVQQLLTVAREKAGVAKQLAADIAREIGKDDVRKAFVYLDSEKLPEVQEKPINDPQIEQAAQAIADGKPQPEIAGLVLPIPKRRLDEAIHVAEDNALAFEKAAKSVDQGLGRLDRFVQKQAALAQEFHVAAAEVAMYVPTGNSKLNALAPRRRP